MPHEKNILWWFVHKEQQLGWSLNFILIVPDNSLMNQKPTGFFGIQM